jgi:hypothetical protein
VGQVVKLLPSVLQALGSSPSSVGEERERRKEGKEGGKRKEGRGASYRAQLVCSGETRYGHNRLQSVPWVPYVN